MTPARAWGRAGESPVKRPAPIGGAAFDDVNDVRAPSGAGRSPIRDRRSANLIRASTAAAGDPGAVRITGSGTALIVIGLFAGEILMPVAVRLDASPTANGRQETRGNNGTWQGQ